MHLDRLDLSGDHGGGEDDGHARLDDAGLDTSDGDRANATDLVHILEGKAEGLVDGALGRLDGVERLKEVLLAMMWSCGVS